MILLRNHSTTTHFYGGRGGRVDQFLAVLRSNRRDRLFLPKFMNIGGSNSPLYSKEQNYE
jgi:hypothetical protein